MEGGDSGQTETSCEEEDGVDLRLVCERFELGQGDGSGGDTYHRGVYQGRGRVAAGEVGDELGIGDDLLVGGDGSVKVSCHASLYLRQSIDAPGGGVLVVE